MDSGNDRFEDVSRDAGPVLSVRTVARGACFADYDNDGKVDAFVVNLGARGTLLHNISTNTGHWIAIKLKGTKSNRDGIGARVEVFAGGKRYMEERVASSGYLSQNDDRLHFGLGAANLGGQDRCALAQRPRPNTGEARRGPSAHRRGAEMSLRDQMPDASQLSPLAWLCLISGIVWRSCLEWPRAVGAVLTRQNWRDSHLCFSR